MNPDFVEMLAELHAAGADFLVVGAHALAVHGRPRATGDLELWVRSTPDNALRVYSALQRFGAPLQDLTVANPVTADVVYQIVCLPPASTSSPASPASRSKKDGRVGSRLPSAPSTCQS